MNDARKTLQVGIAAAIANARGTRRGVPAVENVLDMLPEHLLEEVLDDAAVILQAITPETGIELQHMNEPQLAKHLGLLLGFLKACETADTIGSMLIIFQEDNISQYGATVMREDAPAALRELADRLERNQTVKR